jgi:hypothetical protein
MEDNKATSNKPTAKVVIITNLSRNVVETHLKTIFGFYGEIVQIDLPLYGKCTRPSCSYCTDTHVPIQLAKTEEKPLWNMPNQHPPRKPPPT